MPEKPKDTLVGPTGQVCFAPGGVLEPGWRAAVVVLKMESMIARKELGRLITEGAKLEERQWSLDRIQACELVEDLLRVQAKKLNMDV